MVHRAHSSRMRSKESQAQFRVLSESRQPRSPNHISDLRTASNVCTGVHIFMRALHRVRGTYMIFEPHHSAIDVMQQVVSSDDLQGRMIRSYAQLIVCIWQGDFRNGRLRNRRMRGSRTRRCATALATPYGAICQLSRWLRRLPPRFSTVNTCRTVTIIRTARVRQGCSSRSGVGALLR